MKNIKLLLTGAVMGLAACSCTDLDETVFDRIDADVYYQDENSVKGAVASIYSSACTGFLEYFWYLNEFSADQIAWRTWNGGMWGWDEAEKYVLSAHAWNSESLIIRQSWENAWTTIGLCNTIINDLQNIDPASLRMTREQLDVYIAEVRTMRAWAYYNNFELWGGSLPLNISVGGDIPGSAGENFEDGCHVIFDFISTELDEACPAMMKETGNSATRTRLNQAMNRMLKMRLLLNAPVFINEDRFTECETLCNAILAGEYGTYELAADYRNIFDMNNATCPEIVFAFAQEDGKRTNNNRNTPFLPYNYFDFVGGTYAQAGWNCVIVVPSYDNSGNVRPEGGTDNPRSFITDYGDKLGAPWARMHDNDVRKASFHYDEAAGNYTGQFLVGPMLDYNTGAPVVADADRDGQALVYVDQVGTFLGLGRSLETVMSPRWGETNSGIRYLKYPIYPESVGFYFVDAEEVEFRLAEVYYTLAECKLRKGNADEAKRLVNTVKARYFANAADIDKPGPGMTAFDLDWMLSEWGIEFLNEGRRRRTDLRRFDKFTQGQWWFFGRATEDGFDLPARRDRKYEWYPLPASALMVNPGLRQNPNY